MVYEVRVVLDPLVNNLNTMEHDNIIWKTQRKRKICYWIGGVGSIDNLNKKYYYTIICLVIH